MSESNFTADGSELRSEPTAALVEIQPGLAILFGDRFPAGIDITPFTLLDHRTRESLNGAIARASGLGNLAAQGVNGVMQAQGLVRLAPQTLKALETAKPLVSDGWNLGTLMASNGEFAASVRWLPAAGASAASIAASLGPAIAMLAIQMQLSEITKLAQHNLEIGRIGLEEARRERRAAIQANHGTIVKMVRLAQSQGGVSKAIYNEVRGIQSELEAQVITSKSLLSGHIERLQSKSTNKDRRRYLEDHGEDVLAVAHSLVIAQTSKFTYQALWAGNLFDTINDDDRNEGLARRVIEDGVAERDASLAETDWLLNLAEREFGVMAELDGNKAVKFFGESRAARDVSRMARQLRSTIANIRGQAPPHGFTRPSIPMTTVFKNVAPDEIARILAFRLGPAERVLALAEAKVHPLPLSSSFTGWLTITDQRLLLADKDQFKRYARIGLEVPLAELRYVRFAERDKGKGPVVDVVTTNQNIRLVFDDWAASGPKFDQAKRFSTVLASFMRLPESEIPAADIPEFPRNAAAEASAQLE